MDGQRRQLWGVALLLTPPDWCGRSRGRRVGVGDVHLLCPSLSCFFGGVSEYSKFRNVKIGPYLPI